MIRVNHLSIRNIKEDRQLLTDLSFVVNPGEKIALIGEEGNGKSSILKALLGLPLPGFEVEGNAYLDEPVGYLEQNILERWGNTNVLDYFLLDKPGGEIEDYNILAKIPAVLTKMGFPSSSYDEKKDLREFSGGEVIKLALAKLEIRDYHSFLLDEPSNDLDLESLALLKAFILERKEPLLFVSHDEDLLESCASGLLHLEQLKHKSEPKVTFVRIPYEDYKERREDLFEKQTQVVEKKQAELQTKKEKWAKIYQEVKYDQDQCVRVPTQGRLLKKKMKTLLSAKKRFEKEEKEIGDKPEADPVLHLVFPEAVSVPNWKRILEFHGPLSLGDRLLLPQIDFDLLGPAKIALVGRNGIGKSTFLKALYEKNEGRADIKLGYMPQNYLDAFNKGGTILSFLCPSSQKEDITRTRLFLGSLRYTSEEMLYPLSSCSGGQKAKLFFLKMVLDEDNVLLLDEPTRNLSPFSSEMLYSLLSTYQGAVLAVSHDKRFLKRLNFQGYRMDENGIHPFPLESL